MADRTLPRLGWLCFALVTIGLLIGLLLQQVDSSNQALKVPDSVEAARLQQLATIVSDDPVVLLSFIARGDLPVGANDRLALTELQEELRSRPDVSACDMPAIDDPGIVLLPTSISADDAFATAKQILALAREKSPVSLRLVATGLPLIEGTIAEKVAGERTTIVPLLLAVLFAAAWAFYRRIRLAVAVLLPALTAIAWTGGTVAWLGHRLDPIASLLDPVLLTIGVAASVHFVEAFRRARSDGHEAPEASIRARQALRKPAFWATTTTMLGLWSLTINDTPAVVDFGLRAAMGVALAHLFTFTLLPTWLAATGVTLAAPEQSNFAQVWLRGLRRRQLLIVAVFAAITALAIAGLARVETDNDPMRVLPASDPERQQHDELTARLGAVEVFHLLVANESAATQPARLLPFLAEVRTMTGVAGLAGPVQRGITGDLAVPLLLAPGGSFARDALFTKIESTAVVLGLDDVVVAGPSAQIARDSVRLVHGLLGSLGVSLVLLTLAMAIGLRSIRLSLLAMIPNLLPSVWLYGGLGWSGKPVSVATAMIGCTMLGLIVDNTLHLLHHYRDARASLSQAAAVQRALNHCGRAMTMSSAALMLGFMVAATSHLETTVEFALLATVTIAVAWLASAVLLPTLLLPSSHANGVEPDQQLVPSTAPQTHPAASHED